MNDFIKNFLAKLKEIYGKLNGKQKAILFGVIGLFLFGLYFLFSFSSSPEYSYLYPRAISPADYALITKKLQEWGIEFDTKDDKYILVQDENTAKKIRMKLGQAGIIPSGVKGWEIFDTQKWTTTDFERNVMLRRAVIGEITKHIKMLDDIEDVKIDISMPQPELFSDKEEPYEASVTITPAPYSDITKNKKKIKGIIKLIAFGVPHLKEENIVITDNLGNILSDFSDEEENRDIAKTKMMLRIQEKERRKLIEDIKRGLSKIVGEDRIDLTVKLEFNFDQQEIERKDLRPMIVKRDNPNTSWDDSEVKAYIPVSQKTTKETFKGPAWIPEGPPGVENAVPPGMNEKIKRFTHYNKDENIVNNITGEEKSKIKKQPFSIAKISAAVWVDGWWEKVYDKNGELVITKEGRIKRIYHPISDKEIKKLEDIVKAAIGYNRARGDMVVVKHMQFDRRKQFEEEDNVIRRKRQLRKTLLAAISAIFILFLGTLLYRAIAREIERRRKIREEELARQHQALREAALRAAEEEAASVELSLEEKARLEMQENAINLAKERPEDVAKLIRTWLAEE